MDDERTYAIIGAAMQVHRALGPGLREVCYQRALAVELEARRIPSRREVPVPILYRGQALGTFRADFECAQGVLLEVKARPFISEQDALQLSQYLVSGGHAVGLVLNFGTPSLQVRRVLPRRPGQSAESGERSEPIR